MMGEKCQVIINDLFHTISSLVPTVPVGTRKDLDFYEDMVRPPSTLNI